MDTVFEEAGLILTAPRIRIGPLQPEISYSSAGRRQRWLVPLRPNAEESITRSPDRTLSLAVSIENKDSAIVVRTTLRNESETPVRLESMAPLATHGACEIGRSAAAWSVLRQGYQSWTGTRSFRAVEADPDPYPSFLAITAVDIRRPSGGRPGDFRSDLFAAIANLESHESAVLGFLSGREAFGGIEVRIKGDRCERLAAVLDYDGIPLAPGAEIMAPPLWIAAGHDEHDLIASYADAAGAEMAARIPDRNPIGWCSWYYYFTRISEERILENLKALADLRKRYDCDYVQVDDGYQSQIGDWLLPNAKFPHGMGWLAEKIRNAGFDAGIWTAPFIARPESRLMRGHPDWFVRDDRGRPRFAIWNPGWAWFGRCYALDTTHPEVLEWLRATFQTIAHDWGYHVLKLDFLYAAALPGHRYDPSVTRAQALRRGLDAIREGAGNEAFLLGCGCPLGPAVGVVDAMRIGPDVTPWWSNWMAGGPQRSLHGVSTKHAVRNILTRAFSHRRWWLNDPDCLMIRDAKTRLSEEEVRSLATAIAVTDGMVVLSDRIERLSESRLELLDRTMQLTGGQARIVDLMRADMPEVVVSRSAYKTVVAVFNFTNAAQARSVDLTELGVAPPPASDPTVEWWTGKRLRVESNRIDFGVIPPHGCRVLVL